MDILAHGLGALAFILTILGFACPNDRRLQQLNLLGCMAWALHFALLGLFSATGMLVLACLMIAAAYFGRDRISYRLWQVNLAIVPVVAGAALIGAMPWVDLLPVVGGFLINTGIVRCRGHAMSAMIGGGEVFWVGAGLAVGSPAAIASNLVNLSALSVRVYRSKQAGSPE